MKLLSVLLLLLGPVAFVSAQVQVDSNYTVLAQNVVGVGDVIPFLLPDFNRLVIQDNRSGKMCRPEHMDFTFVINSEALPAPTMDVANYLAARVKPRDKIFIDKIIMPKDCFDPPKQIVLVIQ